MKGHKALRLIGLLLVLMVVAAACGGDGEPTEEPGKKGGTFRMETDELPWISSGYGWDPTTEYFQISLSMFPNLLVRPLMNGNHRSPDKGGNTPRPDLAAGQPEVSADGLTYTFKIRDGVKWQPPINRDVTSDDVLFAFERLGTKVVSSDAGNYAFYYTEVIDGMQDFEDKKANKISGITTPDAKTIVFKLNTPTGDFLQRLMLPATAPIPREVGKCFMTKPNEYGPFVMSTGPYMTEGSDTLDPSSCANFRKTPPTGFNVEQHLFLVRNPNYGSSPEGLRSALPDRFELRLNTNPEDSYAKLERGQLEHIHADIPPAVLKKYQTTETLKQFLKIEPDDATWYLTFNLTTPPFTDVHIRKAVNYAINRQGMIQVIGGPVTGKPALHVFPETVLPIPGYDPYEVGTGQPNVEKAKAEMKLSRYDTDKDGVCDARQCRNILHVTRNTDPFPKLVPVIEQALAPIGITLRTQEVQGFYGTAGVTKNKVPFTSGGGWGKDYADPITFIIPLFLSSSIAPEGNVALPLVGLKADQAGELGVDYPAGGVPSIDADVAECTTKSGQARTDCWIALDKKLMEEIVPWAPWRWSAANHILGPAVTGYDFDAFASWVSYGHMGVDTAKQTT